MKKENANVDEKKPVPVAPDKQAPVKSGKPASRPGKAREKKHSEDVQLPVLVEFAYSLSAIGVVLAALIVAIVSIVKGASLIDLVIRTGVTILVIGGLLILASWQISAGVLKAGLAEIEEEEKKQELEKSKEAQESEEQENTALEVL
jgi:hypothetical protein